MSNRTYHPRGKLVDGYRVKRHPLYPVWASMLSRCSNPNEKCWINYAGRGISVCERWHHFENFAADMGPRPFRTATLERTNNDGDYSPDNCIWATRTEQCINRRRFKNNTTGATGVVKHGDRFIARFDLHRKRVHLGYFNTIEEAADARHRAIATAGR